MSTLEGKIAVVFGAGGSIGSAVARTLAAQGATLYLSGRTRETVDAVAAAITGWGGKAQAAVVDATDDRAVDRYVPDVVAAAGRIDIVLNAMGPRAADYGNGKSVVEQPVDEYMVALTTLVKSQFITARAAARIMIGQRSGVIIFVTGSPARGHVPGSAAIGTAFGAIETFMENLAFQVGPAGVRAVCLRTTANIDSRTIIESMDSVSLQTGLSRETLFQRLADRNFLQTPATVADTASMVAALAAGGARMVTGTVVNASAAAAMD